jgi:hypothetical protein
MLESNSYVIFALCLPLLGTVPVDQLYHEELKVKRIETQRLNVGHFESLAILGFLWLWLWLWLLSFVFGLCLFVFVGLGLCLRCLSLFFLYLFGLGMLF